jgi:hypothetical protein
MFGRVPTQPPIYFPSAPPQMGYANPAPSAQQAGYDNPLPAAPQGAFRPAPLAARQPAPAPAAPAVAAAPRPNTGLIARGAEPDEPVERPREMITLPSPEELGVGAARGDAALDWAATHRRLEALGAVCFQMHQLPRGGWGVTCLLPTGRPNTTHRVEAEADSKAEAVRLALEQAEGWAQKR